MTNKSIEKDERTIFIENASYKLGYNFISFALLLDVVYRSLRFNESSWDLLALSFYTLYDDISYNDVIVTKF